MKSFCVNVWIFKLHNMFLDFFKTILFPYDQPVYNIRNYYFVGKPVQCTLCYHYMMIFISWAAHKNGNYLFKRGHTWNSKEYYGNCNTNFNKGEQLLVKITIIEMFVFTSSSSSVWIRNQIPWWLGKSVSWGEEEIQHSPEMPWTL